MAPVIVGKELRPLPKAMWDTACAQCNRRQSCWTIETNPICSTCYLYSSAWSQTNRTGIDSLIAEVEASVGKMFERDVDGRLARAGDADRILGAIVLTSRLFEVQNKVAAVRRE